MAPPGGSALETPVLFEDPHWTRAQPAGASGGDRLTAFVPLAD